MKNSLTEDELKAIATKSRGAIKINAIWDYKADYIGGPALTNRSSGYDRVAMYKSIEHENDSEEYRCALAIVRQIHKYKEEHSE